jgi:hypothetical protein
MQHVPSAVELRSGNDREFSMDSPARPVSNAW